ncbi:SMP-30/gluconolactonase/LRE family protein [Micromonospora sp. CPCC 206061]|uniref:SMP-30/gluconolactonase/LRE family protein n=1 Tax=Micromonospora sp. CPCC 206061 TaxID=3122410 RepID=UPI002FF199E4
MILKRLAVPLLALGMLGVGAAPATAEPRADKVIVLPGATSAEGIAAGAGSTFYAGDLFAGDIFRGDVRRGTAELFIDAPAGRNAVGLRADLRHNLLFVAGGATGQAYVYHLRTGATVATYQIPNGTLINDVAVTRRGAWFTDSAQGKLFFVPVDGYGKPGPLRTLTLTGPAADTSGEFNLNGIAATADGRTLLVAHSAAARIFTVDPVTGASAVIEGVEVPNVDGIVLDGRRLWAVQNFNNQISRFQLSGDLSEGTLKKVITSPHFAIPTTAALFGHRLAAVNAHFDTGFPPTSPTYEVVVVDA